MIIMHTDIIPFSQISKLAEPKQKGDHVHINSLGQSYVMVTSLVSSLSHTPFFFFFFSFFSGTFLWSWLLLASEGSQSRPWAKHKSIPK